MKKYLYLLLFLLLFIPISVFAEDLCEDGEVVLKDLVLKKTEGLTEVLEDGEIVNNKIKINLKMYEVGDSAVYKFTVENNSNQEFLVDTKTLMNQDPYIVYDLVGQDNSNIVEKKSEKKFTLTVTYQNELEKTSFKAGKYDASKSFLLELRDPSLINPVTGSIFLSLLLTIVLLTIGFLFVQNTKKRALLLLGLFIIPLATFAYCKYDVDLELNVIIGYVKPNPCTYDGELVQGAEYVNGQYTYQYMKNKMYDGWSDIEEDGWGVVLTDTSSSDPVTTTLCTSINDKPIVSMAGMFYNSRTTNIDTSSFDTSDVTNMYRMFGNCSMLEGIDVSNFDTSNVTNMSYMFYYTGVNYRGDLEIDVSNFVYSDGMTKNIDMFAYAGIYSQNLTINVPNLNLENATEVSYVFEKTGVSAQNVTINADNWNLPNVNSMYSLFSETGKAAGNIEINANNWNIGPLAYTSSMLSYIGQYSEGNVTINLNDWQIDGTINIQYFVSYNGEHSANVTINADNWNLPNVTSVYGLFARTGYYGQNVVLNVSNWSMPNVTDAEKIFSDVAYEANKVIIDADNWSFGTLTKLEFIFYYTGFKSTIFNVSIKNWDLTNVTKAHQVFYDVLFDLSIETTDFSLDVSGWNTSTITDMNNMFYYCFGNVTDLTITGLSDWDVSNVTNLRCWFYSSGRINERLEMDLSTWDVSNVTSFDNMFAYSSTSTQEINFGDLSNWNIQSGACLDRMFMLFANNTTSVLNLGTLNIPASADIDDILNTANVTATINLLGNPSSYRSAFSSAATKGGNSIVVNYTSGVTDIDNIIATNYSLGTVTKGELITT